MLYKDLHVINKTPHTLCDTLYENESDVAQSTDM